MSGFVGMAEGRTEGTVSGGEIEHGVILIVAPYVDAHDG